MLVSHEAKTDLSEQKHPPFPWNSAKKVSKAQRPSAFGAAFVDTVPGGKAGPAVVEMAQCLTGQ